MTCLMPINQQLSTKETWSIAMQWVSTNRKLIRQIASPYLNFMVGDYDDLYQEAIIAAVKALAASHRKQSSDQFIPFFRVIFKTSCIKLSPGVQTCHCPESHPLSYPERAVERLEPTTSEIGQALMTVSKRQREVCLWLLQQPTPVSTPEIASHFNISRRHACRLVSGSIERIQGASS